MKRKIENYLTKWKTEKNHSPIIVKGARQVGKTYAIEEFGKKFYKSMIEIDFSTNKNLKHIFDYGYTEDDILKGISFAIPDAKFVPGQTLIFFDEVQLYPDCLTSLKQFKLQHNYDVICSGSMMGINYNEVELNSVGYKEDYNMYSMDFEEFLWAKGYSEKQINDILNHLLTLTPFNDLEYKILRECFYDFLITGGMPEIVQKYIDDKNFNYTLKKQKQLILDYEQDITKYAKSIDKGKILDVYRNIPYFLGKENKKYQISKIKDNARNRDYIGSIQWLENAGIINQCFCLNEVKLPLRGNYDMTKYKIYFSDTGLLLATLDKEAQSDLRNSKNFNVFSGALYESIASETLTKQGYDLFYYKDDKSQLEMDFFVRNEQNLIPIEVKAKDGATISLNNLIKSNKYQDIKFGIKFCDRNIGYNGMFYTFPFFTMFLLDRFINQYQSF